MASKHNDGQETIMAIVNNSQESVPRLVVRRRAFENGSTQQYDIYDGGGRWLCSVKPSARVTNRDKAIAQAMFQLANLAGNPHLSEQDHDNLDNV
jgi:hypothetical protein